MQNSKGLITDCEPEIVVPTNIKRKEQEELEAKIQEFIKNGGNITIAPAGGSTRDYAITTSWLDRGGRHAFNLTKGDYDGSRFNSHSL